ncbi:MAG: hypothetical protein IKO55_00875 [Kiritimatiellae bacterium]|jgi:hypothetical protein|nr:hypothetical protein [Kiritimatiellia bacterium]
MKYTYAYKSSDGSRHEASMDAESREAVFEALRKKGIRPIKVIAEDGSKANGEIRGVRRRVVGVAAVLAAIVAVIATSLYNRVSAPPLPEFESGQTRRQIIGDTAIIDKGIATGWSDVFPEEGDRFFASFAIPGVRAGQRNTTVEEIKAALDRDVEVSDSDGLEARQVKSMVAGMKAEARAYINAGGSIVDYGKRLTERQDAEIAIYERAKAEIDHARKTMSQDDFIALWEGRNDQLRNLGIKLVPLE